MQKRSATCLLLMLLGLLSNSACTKSNPEVEGLSYIDGVPYYHFTDDDRRWLQAKEGDEWTFKNVRGDRRVYRMEQARQELQAETRTATGLLTSGVLLSYYDYFDLRITRTDTLLISGEIHFYRGAAQLTPSNAAGTDPNKSQFYATGIWYDFVGNTDTGTCNFQGMQFPIGAGLKGPFQRLNISGRTYTEVVAFIGTPQRAGCIQRHPNTMQELYYDRQSGIVRMVSLAGEVWERVP